MFKTSTTGAQTRTSNAKQPVCNAVPLFLHAITQGYTNPAAGRRGYLILYSGANYLWALNMELGLGHPSGALNFEVAPRFKKKNCTPASKNMLERRKY